MWFWTTVRSVMAAGISHDSCFKPKALSSFPSWTFKVSIPHIQETSGTLKWVLFASCEITEGLETVLMLKSDPPPPKTKCVSNPSVLKDCCCVLSVAVQYVR